MRHAPLAAILGLAAVNFLFGLGASSLFIDEAYSWQAAAAPLHGLLERVQDTEVAPPTYYLLLGRWIDAVGSDSEWVLRLPSALGGVALTAAVYWVGNLVAGRRAALVAAGLTALSPFVLEQAQQARSYVFLMLAATVAVGAAIRAEREEDPGIQRRWLALAAAAAVATAWLHYTGLLAVGPLVAWVVTREAFSSQARIAFGAGVGVAMLPMAPLLLDQLGQGHGSFLAPLGRPNLENALELAGSPFDGRAGLYSLTGLTVLGAVVVCISLAIFVMSGRKEPTPLRDLLLGLVLVPIAAVIVATLIGKDVMVSRYVAVAAPFMLVVIAMAVVRAPRPVAAALLAGALVSGAAGSFASHRPSSYYPDVRGAVDAAGAQWREGDVLVAASGNFVLGPVVPYYARSLPEGAVVGFGAQDLRTQLAYFERRRVWLLADPSPPEVGVRATIVDHGYVLVEVRRFPAAMNVWLTLAEPRPPRPKRARQDSNL